jgi:hypothetical protein
VARERALLHAEHLPLGVVRVRDERTVEPRRAAGDARDRFRHPAAGAGFGGGDEHAAFFRATPQGAGGPRDGFIAQCRSPSRPRYQ